MECRLTWHPSTSARRLLKCFHCYAACSITRQKQRHKSTYTFHTQPQKETTLTLFWCLPIPHSPFPTPSHQAIPWLSDLFPTRIGILSPLGIGFVRGQQMDVHSASQFIRKRTKVFIVKRKRFCSMMRTVSSSFSSFSFFYSSPHDKRFGHFPEYL